MDKCPYFEMKSAIFCGVDYHCKASKNNNNVRDDVYYKYCKNNYKNCSIYMQNKPQSGCYLTTITCNILGKQDNDRVLNNIRMFRNNILQKEQKYEEILKNYDIMGPIISKKLISDPNKKEIASNLYNNFLNIISNQIENREYESAINAYWMMTSFLIMWYNLSNEYQFLQNINYGYEEDILRDASGHGKKRILKKNLEMN